MSTVILANGDFPRASRLREALAAAEHVVCCDGAAEALLASKLRVPDLVVGDLDSLPESVRRAWPERIVCIPEQETNDLSKAFRVAVGRGWADDILILGATGKRDDHTLGNLSLLFDFARETPRVRLWTDYGAFTAVPESATIPCRPGQQVSIFSADASQPITARGLAYPLHKLRLERWWNGTLNEALGDAFSLQFPAGTPPLLVYSPWPACDAKSPRAAASALPWNHIHFCGCGGVGMAGLAQIALDAGARVSGSDLVDSALLRRLGELGAEVHVGQDAPLPAATELLVYSSAVPSDNPERQEAARRGIPQCRRGEFLARVAPRFQRVVAVAGSHGKTTTTAMLAHILRACGRTPGFMVGGAVNGWERTAAAASWDILVTEADESDRTQELLLPDLAVILNVDDDHSWAIGGTDALEGSFATLARHSLSTLTWDTPDLRRILRDATRLQALPTEAADAADLSALPVPGRHNRANAAIAVAAAEHLGVARDRAVAALATFPGVQRRLTVHRVSRDGRHVVVDDYAHHPTELAATLATLREQYPGHELTVYFQPHRPERLLRYGGRFAELLARHAAHTVVVTPFLAWEDAIADADPRRLADAVNARRPGSARTAPCDGAALAAEIRALLAAAAAPQLVAVIGAGDIISVIRHLEQP